MIPSWSSLSTTARFVVVATAAALVALVPGAPGPLRAVAAVTFLLVGPGLAWVHTLPVRGVVEQAACAIALSLAVDVLVAEVLMFAGMPGPIPAAIVLAIVAIAGVLVGARQPVAAPA
jgi:hypothetical protein